MAQLLFVWELGANLGHLSRDLILARACRAAGHQIILAVADLVTATSVFEQEGFTLVQAPLIRKSIKRSQAPVNYADMLLHEGYDDIAGLKAAIVGWIGLYKLAKPDLVIFNHAPTALIAARIRKLNVLMVGTGFEIPPPISPPPSFRPWQEIPQSILQHAENQVLVHINHLLINNGQPPLQHLHCLFEATQVQLNTFSDLDPFGPRFNCDYVGPIYELPTSATVSTIDWESQSKKRIFAYLRPNMGTCKKILNALQFIDAEIVCAIPNMPMEWDSQYNKLRLFSHPVDLTSLLSTADLVITYGAGTIATALLAGSPVILIPQMIEQFLHGIPLERTGAGLMWRDQSDELQCISFINTLLTTSSFKLQAGTFAKKYGDYKVQHATQKLLAQINLQLNNSQTNTA